MYHFESQIPASQVQRNKINRAAPSQPINPPALHEGKLRMSRMRHHTHSVTGGLDRGETAPTTANPSQQPKLDKLLLI